MEQKFGVGDIVTDGTFEMKVVEVIQDDDGSYYYGCEPTTFSAGFAREIPQDRLKHISEQPCAGHHLMKLYKPDEMPMFKHSTCIVCCKHPVDVILEMGGHDTQLCKHCMKALGEVVDSYLGEEVDNV